MRRAGGDGGKIGQSAATTYRMPSFLGDRLRAGDDREQAGRHQCVAARGRRGELVELFDDQAGIFVAAYGQFLVARVNGS